MEVIKMTGINDILAVGGVIIGIIGSIFGVLSRTISTLKSTTSLIDWIEQKAEAGVKAAEQLGHSESLQTNEEKFATAQNTVYAALKEINRTPTDNQKKLIDDFIQKAVNDLGHAPVTEAQKNSQLQKMKQELAAVKAENEQLKQKLTAIQSAACQLSER